MPNRDWKVRAAALKQEVYALYLCSRHPKTPLYAKVFALFIVAYALSPIDLIPDFIPVLGYLDDLVLIPAAIVLLIKMIPKDVFQECREKARKDPPPRKIRSWMGALMIVSIWLVSICATIWLISLLTRD